MKKETIVKTMEYTHYICEGCGAKFGTEEECEEHENEKCTKSTKAKAFCESWVDRRTYYIRGRFTSMACELVGTELTLCKVIGYRIVDSRGDAESDGKFFQFIVQSVHFQVKDPYVYSEGNPAIEYSVTTECCSKPYPPWGDWNLYGYTYLDMTPEEYEHAVETIHKIIIAPPTEQKDLFDGLIRSLPQKKEEEE